MNPKHHNPTKKRPKGGWAHAPYNFIPLPEKVVTVDTETIPCHDIFAEKTGYIDCAMETRSPLYTRCALNPEFFREWSDNIRGLMQDNDARNEYAQFFHLDDAHTPVIPGSSLRGMVRTLVEIVGYGKMQWVTDEPLVFRAVGDTTSLGNYYRGHLLIQEENDKNSFTPLMLAGYLEKQGSRWFIRPAQTIDGTTFARIRIEQIPNGKPEEWHDCKNACRLWVRLGKYDYQPVRGGFIHLKYTPVLEARAQDTPEFQEVVLARSGPMNSKKREVVVFPPDPSAHLIEISDDLVRAYRDQLTQGQQSLLGAEGALKPHQPIFYLIENDELVFFGHLMMFRLPYNRSSLDLVPKNLRAIDSIDLSEAIFGFVSQGKQNTLQSRSGRVFFTDAHLEPQQFGVLETEVTPKILSGPKPTTFQHYLTQQQPDAVDSGKRDKQGNPKMELRLDHYASPPPHETVIRGHKLYWHRGPIGIEKVREKSEVDWKTDKQHTTIRPVKAGVRFRFRIYFENLCDYELGTLLWVLTLPGEENKDYCHSLGMGKPLGMGAVKITPTLYLSDREGRYCQLFDEAGWYRGERQETDTQQFIRAFEDFVLRKIDQQERGQAQFLRDVERIKMLLKMLEWQGPDRRLTEYMTIEPTNEYKERPVLFDPLKIKEPPVDRSSSTNSKTTGRPKGNTNKKNRRRSK